MALTLPDRRLESVLPAVQRIQEAAGPFLGEVLEAEEARSGCARSSIAAKVGSNYYQCIVHAEVHQSFAGSSQATERAHTLLDKAVGLKCLAALLGMGRDRVRRQEAGAPDLRCGRKEGRSRETTWSVDGFLKILYDSLAETLPDQRLSSYFHFSL